MSLIVVQDACEFTPDRSRGTVVIESDITHEFPQAIEELGSTEGKNVAMQFAAQIGCSSPCINGIASAPYAINAEGYQLDQVVDKHGQRLPPQHPRMQIARYRIDIPVAQRGL